MIFENLIFLLGNLVTKVVDIQQESNQKGLIELFSSTWEINNKKNKIIETANAVRRFCPVAENCEKKCSEEFFRAINVLLKTG